MDGVADGSMSTGEVHTVMDLNAESWSGRCHVTIGATCVGFHLYKVPNQTVQPGLGGMRTVAALGGDGLGGAQDCCFHREVAHQGSKPHMPVSVCGMLC